MKAKYLQVYQEIDSLVRSLRPGEKLPSEKALSEKFAVSPMTVRRALTMLIDEKRIQGIPGRGTFICQNNPIRKNAAIPSFSEAITKAGKIPSSRLILAGLSQAAPEILANFSLPADSLIYLVRRLRLADELPMCLEESYLSPQVMPDLLSQDLTGSLYQIFANRYQLPVATSNYTIRARQATPEEADILQLSEPAICLEVHSKTYAANGTLLEQGHSLYRGDLYEFSI